MTKFLIWTGVTFGGIAGGALGAKLDGTGIGAWSIVLSGVGGLVGIWAGFKLSRILGE